MRRLIITAAAFTIYLPALAQEKQNTPLEDGGITLERANPAFLEPQDQGRIYCTGDRPTPAADTITGPEDLPDHCTFIFDPVHRGALPDVIAVEAVVVRPRSETDSVDE